MSLTQTQIIQSLAEALSWFEKELDWGVSAGELGHLTGRIGELYAAMITRGQMALATNQRGYDVVGFDGERISVKTVTSSGAARFNPNTLDKVDRAIVLRINVDEDAGLSIETLLDISREEMPTRLRYLANGMIDFPTPPRRQAARAVLEQAISAEATYGTCTVQQLESGTILVKRDGAMTPSALPALREIATAIGVSPLNSNDRARNTRQLGDAIIRALKGKSSLSFDDTVT